MSCKRHTNTSLAAASYNAPVKRDHSIPLTALNQYITCSICDGYLIHATTVIDCLHTFCKSCLLKYFEDNTDCPKCHFNIHQSHPSHYVAFDRTIQDIVYKLVPGLQEDEERRQEEFAKKQIKKRKAKTPVENGEVHHSEQSSSESINGDESTAVTGNSDGKAADQSQACCSADQDPVMAHHRRDEQIFLELRPDGKLQSLKRPFIRVSGFATITTIRRLLAYFLLGDMRRHDEFDIFCNNELMGRDYSMAFIYKTRWRSRQSVAGPLVLYYRDHVDF